MVYHTDDKDDFEDEFEFDLDDEFDNDDEAGAEQAPAASQVVADRGKSKFPWFVAVAAIGAIGFAGYKFVQLGDTTEQIGEISQQPAPTQAAKEPTTPAPLETQAPTVGQPTTNADPAFALEGQLDSLSQMTDDTKTDDNFFGSSPSSSEDVKNAVSDATSEIEKALSGLKKEIADLSKTNKKVKSNEKDIELTASKIINLDKSMSGLQQDIKQLTRIVKSLAEQVNDLQAARTQLKAARAAKARQSSGSRSGAPSSPKNYVSDSMTIHAIIPGRAWLRTQGGKTVSITEGDMLGEYGKVLKIDAPTGSVITSSGVTIR